MALVLLASTGSVFAQATPALDAAMPVDDSISYRTLPNGMRYWLRPTGKTSGKVSMWLRIGSGSLNEDDDQRGLAHFLEHMAFNGSENFPAGTLIKRFEAAGLTFGAHQNAITSFQDTIYKLKLPSDPKTLELGLLFFSDVAYRLSLDAKEVAHERAVVLAERTARDNAAKRAFTRQLAALAPGSRFIERFPIGEESVIRAATPEKLRAYYRAWYRPDNTVLMIVGDADEKTLDRLIQKHFGGWPASAPTADRMAGIGAYEADRAVVIAEPGLVAADVGVAAVFSPRRMSQLGDYRAALVDRLGVQMVNRRLRDLVLAGQAPVTAANVTADNSFGVLMAEARAKGAPKEWENVLRTLVTELKRVRDHGFSDAEFRYAVDVLRAELERSAQDENGRAPERWLQKMDGAVEQRRLPLGARQEQALAQTLLPAISRADVETSVRTHYAAQRRTFTLSVPVRGLQVPTSEQMLAAVRAVETTTVERYAEHDSPAELTLPNPTPGKTLEREVNATLNIVSATLENGVRVHVRPMRNAGGSNASGRVSVRVLLAGGRINESQTNRGVTEIAALPLKAPATDAFSSLDVQRWLSTRQITITGRDTAAALELDIEARGADVDTGLALAHALLTRARIEPAAFARWQRQARTRQADRAGSVPEQLNDRVDQFMTGSDPRFIGLTTQAVDRLTLADGQAWLEQLLAQAPMEVAIVGDITHARGLALAEKYLGSLAKRVPVKVAHAQARALSVTPGPYRSRVTVDSATPKAAVYVGWRGPDWSDARDWQVLDLASRILSSRLYDEVRERRGLAYTLRAQSSSNTAYFGNGRFRVSFAVDPQKAEEAATVVEQVVTEFMRTGPTPEELRAARQQAIASFRGYMGNAAFWLDMLSDLDYLGGDTAWIEQYSDSVASFTGEDVVAVLTKYVQPDRFVRVIGTPAVTFAKPNGSRDSVAIN